MDNVSGADELKRELRCNGFVVTAGRQMKSPAAAFALGIAEGTLRHWRKRGDGPAFRKRPPESKRGTVWYDLDDVYEYIKGRKETTGT